MHLQAIVASGTFLLCTPFLTQTHRPLHHRLRLFESDIADAKHVVKTHQLSKEQIINPSNPTLVSKEKQSINNINNINNINMEQGTSERQNIISENANTVNPVNLAGQNNDKSVSAAKPAVRKVDPRSINKKIVETFSISAHSKAEMEKLRLYLTENLPSLNQINVITLMHRCGKNKLDLFSFIDIESTVTLLDVKQSGVATSQGIANALYSLQMMTSSTPGSLRLLGVLSEQLLSCREIFDGQAISNTLYGLKGMSSESVEVQRVLSAIVSTIKRGLLNTSGRDRDDKNESRGGDRGGGDRGGRGVAPVSHLRMTPQGIGAAFIGLQVMSSSNSDVRTILSVLADSVGQLTSTNIALDSQAVANILVGLKCCSSDHAEVRGVLVALSKNLRRNLQVFRDMQPRELSMSLQGLQGMSSDHPQVDELLQVLCDGLDYRIAEIHHHSTSDSNTKSNGNNGNSNNNVNNNVRQNSFEFSTGDEVGPALGGLKQMSAENLQVRRLLRHIGRAMGARREAPEKGAKGGGGRRKNLNMNEQNIANSLYGLQSMDCRTEEVRAILNALSREITSFEGSLSGRTIANSLYGLQCMTATTLEVKAVLKALTRKLDPRANDYTGQHIAMSLYGLQWMSGSSKEMEYLISALADRIEQSPLHLSGTHLASALYGMQSMSSNYPYVRRLLKALAEKMPLATRSSEEGMYLAVQGEKVEWREEEQWVKDANSGVELCVSGQETAMMMHGLRCMGSEWAQVQDMLAAVTYRMRTPARTAPGNSTYADPSSPSLGSDGGSSRTTEPGPEIGGSVVPHIKAPSGISRSAVMTAKELSRALNGLQNMGGGRIATPSPLQQQSINLLGGISYNVLPWVDEGGVTGKKRQRVPLPLLQVLTALADRLEARGERLSGPMVATAVYGLQGLSADIPPVRRIVRVLAADLMKSSVPLDSRNMGNIMYGMQKMTMTSRNRQVRELLSSISKAFKMSPYPLSAQAVGNCFYGLQGMSSEIPEVRGVLRALACKVNEMPLAPSITSIGVTGDQDNSNTQSTPSSEDTPRITRQEHMDEESRFRSSAVEYMLSGQNIGNALWGLRNTTSEHEEVREALAALAVKISQSSAELNGQNIGNALYSLHSMDGEAGEVRAVLGALAHKIVVSTQPLSGLDIGMSLFGLRSMETEIPEVRVILAALIVKIRASDCQLKLRDLSMAIIGVLNATPWIRDDFLKILASKTPGMSPYTDDDKGEGIEMGDKGVEKGDKGEGGEKKDFTEDEPGSIRHEYE